ncbi:hypothetical protein I3843_13G121900 [Carya illinoinensis]|nr:hypothetical protein I3843_13G121900 [Carya illinoinensis]
MPPYMPYPPSSNSEDLRQKAPPASTMPIAIEFEQNIGSMSRMSDESIHDANERVFDINEDLDDTTVVQDDEVRFKAPRFCIEFESVKELTTYYKQYAKQEGFDVRIQRTKRDDDGRPVYMIVGCTHGEKYQPKNSNISKPRPTTRMDCKATVNETLSKNDKWFSPLLKMYTIT